MYFSLKSKIMGLVTLLVAILFLVGGASYWATRKVVSQANQAYNQLQRAKDLGMAAYWVVKQYQSQAGLAINQDLAAVKEFDQNAEHLQSLIERLKSTAISDEIKKQAQAISESQATVNNLFHNQVVSEVKYQLQDNLSKLIAKADEAMVKIDENSRKISGSFRQKMKIAIMAQEYGKITEQAEALDAADQLSFWALKHFQAQAGLIIRLDMKMMDNYFAAQAKMDEMRERVERALVSPEEKAWYKDTIQAYENYDTLFQEQVMPAVERQMEKRMAKLNAQSGEAINQVTRQVNNVVESLNSQALKAAQSYQGSAELAQNAMIIVSLSAVALGLGLGLFLSFSIARPINHVAAGLNGTALQVAISAGEVSSSSQEMAQNASRQAATLEETSASLEEMASMTRQNAEHAAEASTLMIQTKDIVGRTNLSMQDLKQAMTDITSASNETAKIIQTIDEVAFQTNLLALNAAVEAARAGDAGAGFAVVADEVRNLANRAAEASQDTQNLIEQNISNIRKGSQLVVSTYEGFTSLESSADQVEKLLVEITAATQEQAQGIGQLNRATTDMDSFTQQGAANAEESAASSEELSSQAQAMKNMVNNLNRILEGGSPKDQG